ncbi:MAG: hypothetical protein LBO05_10910 [Deltaproteobacteria bacterium]|nr:hypothetical protein [Deltaproteobacteria bacterium]
MLRYKLLSLGMLLVFLPLGVYTFVWSYKEVHEPHISVMLLFSGSLMTLIGLVGVLGVWPSRAAKNPSGGGADGDEAGFDDDDYAVFVGSEKVEYDADFGAKGDLGNDADFDADYGDEGGPDDEDGGG